VFVIYTDGVSEAENEAEEQFGVERLAAVVQNNRTRRAAEIHSALREALGSFTGPRPANDDSTLIVLKF
jgi:serine phosphatase RsbU (regulator of sigma subunit)